MEQNQLGDQSQMGRGVSLKAIAALLAGLFAIVVVLVFTVFLGSGQDLATDEDFPFGTTGSSVATSADGNTVIIGSPDSHPLADGDVAVGSARVFRRVDSAWRQLGLSLIHI